MKKDVKISLVGSEIPVAQYEEYGILSTVMFSAYKYEAKTDSEDSATFEWKKPFTNNQ